MTICLLPCEDCKVSFGKRCNQLFELFLLSCAACRHLVQEPGKNIKMTIDRFRQLWTHRYHKYSHIFKAFLIGYLSWFHFALVKLRLKKGQQLVAIIRTEHFGDIVAAEPISRYVRSLYPNAHVVWFVKGVFQELVQNNPNINEVHQEFCVTERKVLLQTGVFDEVLELQFRNNNHCLKCQTFTDNPVAMRRGIDVFTYLNFGNLLEIFAKTSGLIPVDQSFPGDDQPVLYLQESHRARVDALNLQRPYVVLHTQSNYAPKDWPKEKWEKLIDWLSKSYDYEIIEIGLKSDVVVRTPVYRNLCGQLSILETAEVIRRADYFIGLDSGPSHLANAVGTKGIILMGALNNFSTYNPYSGSYGRQERVALVREAGVPCAQMSLEFVIAEVQNMLDQ